MTTRSGDTIGEILKRTRDAKNLSIEQANRDTKISVGVLNALEGDDLEYFESETYLKGFLRNYARYLGLDGDQMWSTLKRKRGGVADGTGAFWDIEEAIREERLKSPRVIRRVVVPLLILVIAILALLLARERGKNRAPSSSTPASVQSG